MEDRGKQILPMMRTKVSEVIQPLAKVNFALADNRPVVRTCRAVRCNFVDDTCMWFVFPYFPAFNSNVGMEILQDSAYWLETARRKCGCGGAKFFFGRLFQEAGEGEMSTEPFLVPLDAFLQMDLLLRCPRGSTASCSWHFTCPRMPVVEVVASHSFCLCCRSPYVAQPNCRLFYPQRGATSSGLWR